MHRQDHHYVAQFHQRGFVENDGDRLWVYDRKWKSYEQKHPRALCKQPDLYTLVSKDGTEDRAIETKILSVIEDQAARVIARLAPGFVPSRLDIRRLVCFIAIQWTRVPSFIRTAGAVIEAHYDEWLRLRFGTLESASEALAQLEKATNKPQISPEKMVHAVTNGRVKAHTNKAWDIQTMFEHANPLGVWLEHCQWTILVAPSGGNFIVSDNPFVSVPPEEKKCESLGYAAPGVTSYFPLTRTLCLMARHGGSFTFSYRKVDSQSVRTVNLNTAANSERYIMAASRTQLESIVNRSACHGEAEPRLSIEVDQPNRYESLQTMTLVPRRYFYSGQLQPLSAQRS